MTASLMSLVALIYLGVAVSYALDGRWGMCLAFIAYAVANVGFVLDLK